MCNVGMHAVSPEDGRGEGQVHRLHAVLVPALPAKSLRGRGGCCQPDGGLGLPQMPWRLQLQQLPEGKLALRRSVCLI